MFDWINQTHRLLESKLAIHYMHFLTQYEVHLHVDVLNLHKILGLFVCLFLSFFLFITDQMTALNYGNMTETVKDESFFDIPKYCHK